MRRIFKELLHLNYDYVLDAISWRVPDWLFKYVRTYLMLTQCPRLFVRRFEHHFLRFATEDDIPLLQKVNIPESLVRERFAHGDRCVIMGIDDRIQSINWGSPGKRYLKIGGAIMDPGRDGVIFHGAYTAEEVRMLGLFHMSFKMLYDSFVAEGRTKVYASIHSLNKLSYNTHLRMNFTTVGEAVHFCFFGIKFTYCKYWPHRHKKFRIFIKIPPDKLYWN